MDRQTLQKQTVKNLLPIAYEFGLNVYKLRKSELIDAILFENQRRLDLAEKQKNKPKRFKRRSPIKYLQVNVDDEVFDLIPSERYILKTTRVKFFELKTTKGVFMFKIIAGGKLDADRTGFTITMDGPNFVLIGRGPVRSPYRSRFTSSDLDSCFLRAAIWKRNDHTIKLVEGDEIFSVPFSGDITSVPKTTLRSPKSLFDFALHRSVDAYKKHKRDTLPEEFLPKSISKLINEGNREIDPYL